MDARGGFWGALESVPGLCAVSAEWEVLMGRDFAAAMAFLRPTGRRATSVPCPLPVGCGCSHEVIEHGPEDIVAVCRCEPRRCDPVPSTRADTVLYEVDRRRLGEAVAVALEVKAAHAPVPGLPSTWSIGTCAPARALRFPVYLTIQLEPGDSRKVVDAMAARAEGPFLLVAPTRRTVAPDSEEALLRKKAGFVALADDFTLGQGGAIRPGRKVEEILRPVLARVAPERFGPAAAERGSPAFRQNGDVWAVWFDGQETTLDDGVGPRHLALLLANPGVRLHAIDMRMAEARLSGRLGVAATRGVAGDPGTPGFEIRRTPAGSGGPAADRMAVRSYRARIDQIEEELGTARAAGDPARAVELEEEAERIHRHLRAVVNIRGDGRPGASDDERARQAVTRAIRRTIRRLWERHPPLARHLGKHLETGLFCLYHPDPPVPWLTE